MKKIYALFLALGAFVSLSAQEKGIDFSGNVESHWGFAAPWTESETSAGRTTIGNTAVTGKLNAYCGNSSAYIEGTAGYEASQIFDTGFYAKLKEAWVDYSSGSWGFRIGRQKTAWGKADGIDITNIICPDDTSSVSAVVSDDDKLAIDALRVSYNKDSFTVDAYWIPFFTPTALPYKNIDFNKPEAAIWNSEYGLKISGYFSAFDVSLYGFYGWDSLPIMNYTPVYAVAPPPDPASPSGIYPDGIYERVLMIGADAAVPLGQTVLRFETAFFPDRHFQKKSSQIVQEKIIALATSLANGTPVEAVDASLTRNELSYLIGLDWMPSDWTITVQYFGKYVFGSLDELDRKNNYVHGATYNVSKKFMNELLELSVSGIIEFNEMDAVVMPSVSYSVSDEIKISGGAYLFIPGPSENGTYGVYKDYSSFFIKAEYNF